MKPTTLAPNTSSEHNNTKVRTLAEMRSAAQYVVEWLKIGTFNSTMQNKWLTTQADAVIQLCDEVMRLRAALEFYQDDETLQLNGEVRYPARKALKESKERFGD